MDNNQLKIIMLEYVDESAIQENNGLLTCMVSNDKWIVLSKKLKEDKSLSFDYLFCLTGIDYGTELGVVYHIKSTVHNHIIVIKVKTKDRENPLVHSVVSLWKTAEFHEREVYDLMGIKFSGHPDLRRLFLEDDWIGHPLRKDYKDEVNIVEN